MADRTPRHPAVVAHWPRVIPVEEHPAFSPISRPLAGTLTPERAPDPPVTGRAGEALPAREIIDWSIKGRSIFARKKPLAPKTLARIYAGAVKFGWPEPFLVILRNHMAAQSIDGPVPTIAARGQHVALAQPVILANRNNNAAKDPAISPAPCFTTAPGGGVAVAEPVILSQHSSGPARAVSEPLPTIMTGGAGAEDHPGCARPALVEPILVRTSMQSRNSLGIREVHEPLATVMTDGGFGLVEPFILSRHAEGAPRSIDDPTPTQVARQSHVLVAPYYGSGSGETCKSAEDPLDTVTAKARFGMVVPITHADGSQRARDVDGDPLPTLTTANRGEFALITAQHGERPGQTPRVHDVDQPAPTIAATGHEDGQTYDILFRMLEPHELAAAMGFDTETTAYQFAGTKTEKIKQIGNAVSVAKMKACVGAIMADAAPKRQAAAVPDDRAEAAA